MLVQVTDGLWVDAESIIAVSAVAPVESESGPVHSCSILTTSTSLDVPEAAAVVVARIRAAESGIYDDELQPTTNDLHLADDEGGPYLWFSIDDCRGSD